MDLNKNTRPAAQIAVVTITTEAVTIPAQTRALHNGPETRLESRCQLSHELDRMWKPPRISDYKIQDHGYQNLALQVHAIPKIL